MNERIDKLLVKAGAYFGGEGVDYSNFDPNKFAELLLEESIKVMMANDYHGEWLGEKLKEHFGFKF